MKSLVIDFFFIVIPLFYVLRLLFVIISNKEFRDNLIRSIEDQKKAKDTKEPIEGKLNKAKEGLNKHRDDSEIESIRQKVNELLKQYPNKTSSSKADVKEKASSCEELTLEPSYTEDEGDRIWQKIQDSNELYGFSYEQKEAVYHLYFDLKEFDIFCSQDLSRLIAMDECLYKHPSIFGRLRIKSSRGKKTIDERLNPNVYKFICGVLGFRLNKEESDLFHRNKVDNFISRSEINEINCRKR